MLSGQLQELGDAVDAVLAVEVDPDEREGPGAAGDAVPGGAAGLLEAHADDVGAGAGVADAVPERSALS